MARSRLGKGLSAIIPDDTFDGEPPSRDAGAPRTVAIEDIQPNPEQPREVFATGELDDLAASIRAHGVLSPLVVRKEDGRFILIAGERRLRAAALAGVTEVPVVVREAPTAQEQLELALIENLQRADLDPIEAAKGYARLVDTYGLTQEEVATRVGKDRATVANAIRLLRLPAEALEALRAGHITAGHARALLPLAGVPDVLRQTLREVVSKQLNVRATERLVRQRRPDAAPSARARTSGSDPVYDRVARLLADTLHTEVAVKPGKKGGKIVIRYGDDEELDRLMGHLRGQGRG